MSLALWGDHCMETVCLGIQHQFHPLLGYQSECVSWLEAHPINFWSGTSYKTKICASFIDKHLPYRPWLRLVDWAQHKIVVYDDADSYKNTKYAIYIQMNANNLVNA